MDQELLWESHYYSFFWLFALQYSAKRDCYYFKPNLGWKDLLRLFTNQTFESNHRSGFLWMFLRNTASEHCQTLLTCLLVLSFVWHGNIGQERQAATDRCRVTARDSQETGQSSSHCPAHSSTSHPLSTSTLSNVWPNLTKFSKYLVGDIN